MVFFTVVFWVYTTETDQSDFWVSVKHVLVILCNRLFLQLTSDYLAHQLLSKSYGIGYW